MLETIEFRHNKFWFTSVLLLLAKLTQMASFLMVFFFRRLFCCGMIDIENKQRLTLIHISLFASFRGGDEWDAAGDELERVAKERRRGSPPIHILVVKVAKFLGYVQQVDWKVAAPVTAPHPLNVISFEAFLRLAKFRMVLAIFQAYLMLYYQCYCHN